MANRYRLRLWTGPSMVTWIAKRLAVIEGTDVVEGTEHVYVTAEGSDPSAALHNLFTDWLRTYGQPCPMGDHTWVTMRSTILPPEQAP